VSEPETSGIGTRLRAARERRGWSREALAVHSGISWSAVAQIESGRRRNVRPDTLSALSGALGVTLDYILHGRPSGSPLFEHHIFVYDTDDELLETAGPFLAEGSERGEATLAVTTKAKIKLLRKHLGSNARTTEFAEEASWYSEPVFALNRYRTFLNSKLEQDAPWVRIVGDPVWTARSNAEVRKWTRYESLVNLAFAASPVTLLCLYDRRSVDPRIVRQAHVTHPQTAGPDGIATSPDYEDPMEFVLESD
jgi:transcriptional regulator with XRE-family HTH domain